MTEGDTPAHDQRVSLPDEMARLAADASTGVLSATLESVRREIVFVKGEIRAARSDAEDEKLGKWLVSRDKISEDDRALTLLAQGTDEARPLGHLLVGRGSIEQDELERELQELTLAIVERAAGDIRAEFEFEEGRSSDQPDTLPDLFTSQIILVAARALEDLEVKTAAIGSHDQVVWPSSDLEHMLQDFNLTPTEGFLLSRLDGTRTIASLFQLLALPEETAVATLYQLILSGVVQVGDSEATPSSSETAEPYTVRKAEAIDEEQLTDRHRQDRQNIVRLAEEVTRVDHYRALGLSLGASEDDVAEAWKKLQKRYDTKRASEAHLRDLGAALKSILDRAREAHEVLSSARDRRRYDRILKEVERDHERFRVTGERGETDAAARSAIVEANLKRADELIHDGELYLAIQLLEQACALEPRPPELVKLARLLLRNPLWTNRALSCMRRAIQVDPGYVDAWLELARFWRRRRNPERERKALEKALAASPEDPRAMQMYRELAGKRELDRLLRRTHDNRN